MRIIAGRFRGHALQAPHSSAIRPTSDRLRESLFNVLVHGFGDAVAGARVIDLFAGTGALGLEALSRGAAYGVFVDEAAEARGLIRANVEALGLGGTTRLFRRDATRLGAPTMPPFDLAFLDPPYGKGLAEQALAALGGGWLRPGALAIVEEAASATLAPPAPFAVIDRRPAGDSQLVFLRFEA